MNTKRPICPLCTIKYLGIHCKMGTAERIAILVVKNTRWTFKWNPPLLYDLIYQCDDVQVIISSQRENYLMIIHDYS